MAEPGAGAKFASASRDLIEHALIDGTPVLHQQVGHVYEHLPTSGSLLQVYESFEVVDQRLEGLARADGAHRLARLGAEPSILLVVPASI